MAIAKTGSGKTLGYLIPGFMHLKRCCNDPQRGPTVLVLSPTRELATQIQNEALKFGKSSRISCRVCYHSLSLDFNLFIFFVIVFSSSSNFNDNFYNFSRDVHQLFF